MILILVTKKLHPLASHWEAPGKECVLMQAPAPQLCKGFIVLLNAYQKKEEEILSITKVLGMKETIC